MSDSKEENQPPTDWDLLTRDPVKFFALAEGYDRKDLKRSYNRLLRQYKPEKYPEEFQRIRGVYEELERALRYGEKFQQSGQDAWQSLTPTESPSADADTETPAKATDSSGKDGPRSEQPMGEIIRRSSGGETSAELDPRSFDALLASISAEGADLRAIYQELLTRKQKTSPEYYALAVLSDLVEKEKPHAFLGWLLKGLKSAPNDAALSSLTYQYLNTQIAEAHLQKTLITCSEVVSNDSFFSLTEGAWDRLMRSMPFHVFVETLKKCEANLSADTQIGGRLTFYLHTLRYAQWQDQPEWSQRTFDFIEENFSDVPSHLEGDFDFLVAVQEYQAIREQFTALNPLCSKLDGVLKQVFSDEGLAADKAMIDCQLELLADRNKIQEAFPSDQAEFTAPFFTLWNWISHETANRVMAQEDAAEIDYQFWGNRLSRWLEKLLGKKTWIQQRWDFMGTIYQCAKYGGIIVAGILIFFVSFFGGSAIEAYLNNGKATFEIATVPAFLVTIGGCIFFYRWWSTYLTEKVWYPYCNRMAETCYRKHWRPACCEFIDRSKLDYFDFRGLLEQVHHNYQEGEAIWINSLVQQDISLAIYATATRYQD